MSEPPEASARPEASEPREPDEQPPRPQRGELVSAAAALVLLLTMFAFAWYGVDGIPGQTQVSSAENAWHGLTLVRWLMLATIIVALGSLVLHATQRRHGTQTNTGSLVAGLGALTALALTWRVLIDLPSPPSVVDQKLGAYLGLLSAFAITFGGYTEMRARAQRKIVRQRAAAREGAADGEGAAARVGVADGEGAADDPPGR